MDCVLVCFWLLGSAISQSCFVGSTLISTSPKQKWEREQKGKREKRGDKVKAELWGCLERVCHVAPFTSLFSPSVSPFEPYPSSHFFFLLPWCLLPLVCICVPVHVHYRSFVCVCEHANPCTRENPESWPPDKWPPSPPKLPVAETIKKSRQCCTHTKKGEKRTGDEEPSGEREQGRRTRPAVSSTMRTRAWQRLKAAPYECL